MIPLLLACAGPPSAAVPAPPAACTLESAMTGLPEFPADALLQSLAADREGELSGWRIRLDGRTERRHHGEWSQREPLSAEALAAVQGAVTAAGLPPLAGHHRAPSLPDDATWRFLQARVGEEVVAIRIDMGCEVAAEGALLAAILDHIP
jgi:hypothetical protein